MNLKFFGITALIGLVYFWISEQSVQALPPGPRTITASWYGERERGRRMANGKRFDPNKFTCASREYPLETLLSISANGKTVAVVVTDRGPHKRLLRTRQIDLSRATFRALAPLELGLIRVTVEKL